MKPKLGLLLLALSLVFCGESFAEDKSTYDVVVKGMSCSQNSMESLECHYIIGKDVEITIAGVGDYDGGITFTRSSGYEGDYYPSFGLQHGCIIIHPGLGDVKSTNAFDYAFISPHDGKVYRTWQECKQASSP